jgi:O-antigen ligase
LVALSIVVVLAYTGARGVAIGQFSVLACMILLRMRRDFRQGLPTVKEFVGAIGAGLVLCVAVGATTGCNSFVRWSALSEVAADMRAPVSKPPVSLAVPNPAPVVTGKPAATAKPVVTGKADPAGKAPAQKPAAKKPVKAPGSVVRAPIKTSISIRLGMWEASLEAIRQAPIIGHGALSLRPIIQDRFGFEHNHNQYLAWLVTGGAIFLVFGLSFISIPILISKELLPVDRAIVILSVTGLWGVSMIFDAFLNLDFYLHYFSLLLGFLFSLVADSAKPRPDIIEEA